MRRSARAIRRFTEQRGPLLAAGLTYQGLFALFAALWVAVSISGLVLAADPALRTELFAALNGFIPGLIAVNGEKGAIDSRMLLQNTTLSVTGVAALGGLIITAVNWLGSARGAVRIVFDVPRPPVGFLLLKLRDLALALVLGVFVAISAALSVASTELLRWLLELSGFDSTSPLIVVAARSIGLVLMAGIDFSLLLAFYRVLSGLSIPWRPLTQGALIGAIGLGTLKLLATLLLGGAGSNPLLASFAVLLGLLIWLNLAFRVVLIGAAWIAECLDDLGVAPDPQLAAEAAERAQAEADLLEARARAMLPRWLRWAVRERHDRRDA